MEATLEFGKEPKKRKWLKVLLIIFGILVALLILLVVLVIIYINGKLNLMPRTIGTEGTLSSSEMAEYLQNNTETMPEDYTGEVLDPEDIVWETLPGNAFDKDRDVVNLLLIGVDAATYGSSRSDAMILCTYNPRKNTVTLTSLMRDMYVQIPGYADNRINASYAFGGVTLLNKCILLNFGVDIAGNFLVDFESFKDVIDLVGGVDITLSEEEAAYMNNIALWEPQDRYLAGTFHAGVNRLGGVAALSYARNRSIGNYDFGRTERQRKVLYAMFDRCKSMSISQLDNLLDEMLPLVTTDMSNSEIIDLAVSVIPDLSSLKVTTHRIPADGTYSGAWVAGMSVLIPDLDANRKVLERIVDEGR